MNSLLTVTVSVDFPALSALVDYLTNEQQQKIDQLTTQVEALTASLAKSQTGLQTSTDAGKAS